MALGLEPERALLNDINPHLINFYRHLQSGFVIHLTMENDKETYYKNRSRFNELIQMNASESQEAAELFYYLNRTGFNGLCRFNSKGFFNVPFGRYKNIKYQTDFTDYRQVLANWEFTCMDFEGLDIEPDDFIYADPPYDVPFTKYSKEGFAWQDQIRLADWLAQHPGPVVTSNQATERILSLYKERGFEIRTLRAPRMISADGNRTPALEMLAVKNV